MIWGLEGGISGPRRGGGVGLFEGLGVGSVGVGGGRMLEELWCGILGAFDGGLTELSLGV